MDKNSPDFYIASTENYDLEEPRNCYIIKRMRGEKRDDYLLISIDPPMIGQSYGLGGKDIDKVIIFTRHVGVSLFPITKWPVYVHDAMPLVDNPEDKELIYPNEYKRIAWAELYETESAAQEKR